eukprot:m.105851 g.105851  ORF g.105851 m.105851 type:complete len:521 (+) comp18961_c0_seq1:1854-3416(+)
MDVVVVGAGLAGLSAATLLVERGGSDITVRVLEAQDRVGGRTYSPAVAHPSAPDGSAVRTDLGAGYVGPSQNHILAKAARLGVETHRVNTAGLNVTMLSGCRVLYEGLIPGLSLPGLLDINAMLVRMEEDCLQVPLAEPWAATKAAAWDRMTVEQWVRRHAWTATGRKTLTMAVRAVLCAEPSEVSYLFWLFVLHSGGGPRRVFEVEQGAQERKLVGGTQQICEKMAETLKERILLKHAVVAVSTDGKNTCLLTCSNGVTIKTNRVIFAVPPVLLGSVEFDPALPPLRQQMLQKLPMGSIIKTVTFYKEAFWRSAGLSGFCVSDEGPVSVTYDDTKPDGKYPAIMGFIQANAAREWVEMTQEERKAAVCAQYARLFQDERAREPEFYAEQNWMADRFSGGCYCAYMGCQVMTQFGRELRQPLWNFHFAGTELARQWAGYMSGAVESGERAAKEALWECGKISRAELEQDTQPEDVLPVRPLRSSQVERYLLPSVPTFFGLCAGLLAVLAAGAYWRLLGTR